MYSICQAGCVCVLFGRLAVCVLFGRLAVCVLFVRLAVCVFCLTSWLWMCVVFDRLEENYEIADGVCIPRSTLYYHYLDFCEANDTQPVNAASFGKVNLYHRDRSDRRSGKPGSQGQVGQTSR